MDGLNKVEPHPCLDNQWAAEAFHETLDDACDLPIENITKDDYANLKNAYLAVWLECAWPAGNC
jgi:hypothetical protein